MNTAPISKLFSYSKPSWTKACRSNVFCLKYVEPLRWFVFHRVKICSHCVQKGVTKTVKPGDTKGELSLYCWPPVWLVWNQLYDYWQFLFLFAKQTNPNQSNRRSTVQWYFPLEYSLTYANNEVLWIRPQFRNCSVVLNPVTKSMQVKCFMSERRGTFKVICFSPSQKMQPLCTKGSN